MHRIDVFRPPHLGERPDPAVAPAPPERASSAQRGYGGKWQKARAGWLKAHPLCVMCLARGETTPASVVDHITPHRGDWSLFWDSANWQSLCAPHHNRDKQRTESKRGRGRG